MTKRISESKFLITGGAGFIGSNIVSYLLKNGAKEVRVIDNLSTGYMENIQEHMEHPSFLFIKGDIVNAEDCNKACEGIDYVLHNAALGSVPRSIKDPVATNKVNVNGTLNMLQAAVQNKIKRFVYASSSSVYGDDKTMPKKEEKTGILLSPYAVTKKCNELYADVFYKTYGLEVIGLRYFNVFGPKQNIKQPVYAAVIPIFINELLNNRSPSIFGDGSTTRDFTYVENVIHANLLAAFSNNDKAINQVFNVAFGGTTSLNTLFNLISKELNTDIKPEYKPERFGDIKDSFADISKARTLLEYSPTIDIHEGISRTVAWYRQQQ
ncbi:MAG: Vi polysaccharide biosynthesis protein VipB/TviC [Bacteroidetes bacterium]|jgi:UDP-N-acetylglucosamine 4-epimerase|nr:Vi polysaccharide biosynthesis protein VipB/TviC [Bacteroidota bacterium]